jgi:hypothetical protein
MDETPEHLRHPDDSARLPESYPRDKVYELNQKLTDQIARIVVIGLALVMLLGGVIIGFFGLIEEPWLMLVGLFELVSGVLFLRAVSIWRSKKPSTRSQYRNAQLFLLIPLFTNIGFCVFALTQIGQDLTLNLQYFLILSPHFFIAWRVVRWAKQSGTFSS